MLDSKKKIATAMAAFAMVALLIAGLIRDYTKDEDEKKSASQITGIVDRRSQQFVPHRVLVKFRKGALDDDLRVVEGRVRSEIPGIGVKIVELPEQASEKAAVNILRARPNVEWAELDVLLPPEQVTPNDPLYPSEYSWSLNKIHANYAWAVTTGSPNIVIAILDTGTLSTHPDLAANIVPGWNIVDNNADSSDVQGHGTAVAGTAAAASNNGLGVASVAWNCKIMPIRVGNSSATYSNIATGLAWASDHGARIANLSWYVTGSFTISAAAQSFYNNGGLVFASAGNYGTTESLPNDPYIVTVGATNIDDSIAGVSNRGTVLDVMAPIDVYTTQRDGGYTTAGGTSYASPTAAGVAALIWSQNPSYTQQQVEATLTSTVDDLGPVGWDGTFGYGKVNASRAVGGVVPPSSPTPPPSPTVTPTTTPTPPPTSVDVYGYVKVNGDYFQGTATVTLSESDGTFIKSVTASSGGFFLFDYGTTGNLLTATAEGFTFPTIVVDGAPYYIINGTPTGGGTPTPTPTPEPTATPSPSPLPTCTPNQVIGNPPVCNCTGRAVGNPKTCKP